MRFNIKKILRQQLAAFPVLEKKLSYIKHAFFSKPPQHIIKTKTKSFSPNPILYSAWTRQLYNDLAIIYTPHDKKSAQYCLNETLKAYQHNQPQPRTLQLLIDVSILIQGDHGTGVQRVVKNLLLVFLQNPPPNYVVHPVYSRKNGIYCYAHSNEPIDTFSGDVFLGLDLLVAWTTTRHEKTFEHLKACGTKLYFVVYDLLPIYFPHFFQTEMQPIFTCWLKQITTQADGIVCISKTIADELSQWMNQNRPIREKPLAIGWFHLGANIVLKKDQILSHSFQTHLDIIKKIPSVLMVSTMEPRKGYKQTVAAFDVLWKNHNNIALIIVGKPGWGMEAWLQTLKKHPEKNKKLFWFNDLNDTELWTLYHTCNGLLMASENEGFGLALIEAAHQKLPILTRDIPIFREVASDHAAYFSDDTPDAFAHTIKIWMTDIIANKATNSGNMPWLTWTESAQQLQRVILKNEWYLHN